MPFANELHVDKALTNIAVKFRNAENSYIADQIAPDVPVAKESDRYFKFDRANFRIPQTIRANKDPSNDVGTYRMTTTSYSLEEHAVNDIVTDRDRANADAPLSPDADTTEYLTDIILAKKEQMVYQLMTNTVFSQTATKATTTCWTWQTTTTDPIGDVQTATTVILQNSAASPNVIAFSHRVFEGLRNHPNILERIKYSERGIVTADILSSVFDIPKVLVGKAVYNTAAEGATESMGWLWQPNAAGTSSAAFIGYVNPTPGIRKPSALYNLVINGKYKTKKWREEKRGGDVIEVSTMFLPVVPDDRSGYLILLPHIA